MTIARYLARKYDLYGDLKSGAIADLIIDGNADLIAKLIPAAFPTLNVSLLISLPLENKQSLIIPNPSVRKD
jgi:hypothetical protein